MDLKKLKKQLEKLSDGQLYFVKPNGEVAVGKVIGVHVRDHQTGKFEPMLVFSNAPQLAFALDQCFLSLTEAIDWQKGYHETQVTAAWKLSKIMAKVIKPH